jgi:hypothetical protein
VKRSGEEALEDEEVERPLEKIGAFSHGRSASVNTSSFDNSELHTKLVVVEGQGIE